MFFIAQKAIDQDMLRYWTAGESHGKALLALIDGFPAGLDIDTAMINIELRLRQGGYGRGGRQKLETDEVEVLTGIWQGKSIGSPITSDKIRLITRPAPTRSTKPPPFNRSI